MTYSQDRWENHAVSGVPGVTYYITVFAVNALGPGAINEYSIYTCRCSEW